MSFKRHNLIIMYHNFVTCDAVNWQYFLLIFISLFKLRQTNNILHNHDNVTLSQVVNRVLLKINGWFIHVQND